jgi:hypothetical protein
MGEFMGVVRQSTVGKLHKLNWKKFPNFVAAQKANGNSKQKLSRISRL